MTPLFQAYSDFWTHFTKEVLKTGSSITCAPSAGIRMTCAEKGSTRKKFSLQEPICLRGLTTATGSEWDVVVDFDEYFDAPCMERPVRTSVHVHLIERYPMRRSEAKHLFGLRFDYDCETGKDACEPLMHAHFDNVLQRRPPSYKNVAFNETDPILGVGLIVFKDCRVPTPRMSLPSVLCFVALLAKSQLSKGFVDSLIGRTSGILDSIKVPIECERWFRSRGFNDRCDIPGWAWYKY